MSENYISGFEIFEYWKDKCDFQGEPIIPYWDIKNCFACNLNVGEMKEGEGHENFWNKKTKLEKAHIVPKHLGGTYDPSNIMFLCKGCHKDSPDFKGDYGFMLWLTKKRETTTLGMDWKDFLKQLEEMLEIHNRIQKYDFMELNIEKILLIIGKNGGMKKILEGHSYDKIGVHGTKVVNSTIVTFMIDFSKNYLDEKFEEFLKETNIDKYHNG